MDKKFISRFLRGAFSTSSGTLATVIFHFLSITIMIRFVSKEVVGLYFLVIATVTFFKLVANLGLDLTLVKFLAADQAKDKNEIVSIILITRAIILLILSAVIFIGSDLILPLLGDGKSAVGLALTAAMIGVHFASISNLFGYALVSAGKPKTCSIVNTISIVILIAGHLILIPTFGYIGAIYATILADIADLTLYYFYLSRYQITPSMYKIFQPMFFGPLFCILISFSRNESILIKALFLGLFILFCARINSDLKNAFNHLPAVREILSKKTNVEPKFYESRTLLASF